MALKENTSSLYSDLIVLFAGVLVLFGFTYMVWVPEIMRILTADELLLECVKSVLKHVYVPMVAYCFIVGEISGNISQIDKLWPLSCIAFTCYITIYEYLYMGNGIVLKHALICLLVAIWGIRLAYLFYTKGGYKFPQIWDGVEDYRWMYVRERLPFLDNNRFFCMLFNLLFVCIYQLFILFLISGGVVIGSIMARSHASIRTNEIYFMENVIACVAFFLIVIETISDFQQQKFQKEKYRRINTDKSLNCSNMHYELGFNVKGLFAYSRHPNFACEQAFWISIYLFTIDTSQLKYFEVGGVINSSIIGYVLLMFLVRKSTELTEDISASKYPMYEKYQDNVSCYIDLKLLFNKMFLLKSPNQNWLKKQ